MTSKNNSHRARETAAFRELNYMLNLGDDKNYLAVENNFDSAEISIVKDKDVQKTVSLNIAQLNELIAALQFVVKHSPEYVAR